MVQKGSDPFWPYWPIVEHRIRAVPSRFDRSDTIRERRMGREPTGKTPQALREEEVRDLGCTRRGERGSFRCRADFLQCAGDSVGVSRELYGRRVREELSLAADCRLDEVAAERAGKTDRDQTQAQQAEGRSLAAATVPHPACETTSEQTDEENPMQHRDQAQVQAGVAIEDVTELVADHALQLIPREMTKRALGDGDHRIVR